MVSKIKFPIYALLDNIRSVFNVGSIFRTSDACGISKVYLCGITAKPPHLKLEKTALGSLDSVDWEYSLNAYEKVVQLKKEGYKIISVELGEKSINYDEFNYPENSVLVFGNEVDGVGKQILEVSDYVIQIPMFGIKESLNVATSYGIVAYEATKQWRKNINNDRV